MSNQHSSKASFTAFDFHTMERALSLAEKGKYSTQPNPRVGCVIVNHNQQIVGEGYHQKAGEAHAEIKALEQAGKNAQGACAYVTLEPCAHTGRTGPCANALVEAGLSKVYVACVDPNPKVSGQGIAILKQAGIEVFTGLCEEQAMELNRAFFFRMQYKRPFITLKLAASLDGKTALANGESKWITSAEARQDVQQHRASVCAILTGANTVLLDNPQLNVRTHELPNDIAELFLQREQQPLRVIIDSKNRLHKAEHKLLNDGQPTLVYNTEINVNINAEQQHQLPVSNDVSEAFVSLSAVFEDLAKREINHIWVEAGAGLSGALFDREWVNELILYQAPKILGKDARGLINMQSKSKLSDALQGELVSVTQVGKDTKTIVRFSLEPPQNKGL